MFPTRTVMAALAASALMAFGSAQAQVTVYDGARFVPLAPGSVELDGFGRGSSARLGGVESLVEGREFFFDTWNVDTSLIGPGVYSFENAVVDAIGTARFLSLTFNSYDEFGVRSTVLFELNALGTQAVGSGTFTVLDECPVQSCVWIDVIGTQAIGSATSGYGAEVIAAVVPEPASVALLALGLAGVGAAVRRRRA